MRAFILHVSFACCLAINDQILLQQGVDLGPPRGPGLQTQEKWGGYFGCWKDSNSRDFAVHHGSGYSRDSCLNKCREGEYRFAGLQWYSHCFCDNSYGIYGKRPESDCSTKCTYGDKTVSCGGGWRNSVYSVPKLLGCYEDTNSRDFAVHHGSGYSRDSCLNKCRDGKYKFAGLQWYSHCFCDNSYGKYGKKPDSDCSTKCTVGDRSLSCGGGWRNSVYEMDPAPGAAQAVTAGTATEGAAVTAAPAGMELDTNPTWVPAFCWGIDFVRWAPKFFTRDLPGMAASMWLCWGRTYGTGIGATGNFFDWEVTGIIHWYKSIFGFRPFPDLSEGECYLCEENFPSFYLYFCRYVKFKKFNIRTFPRVGLGTAVVLTLELQGKFCLGFGIENAGGGKNNLIILPGGGLFFTGTYMGQEIASVAMGTGTLRIKGFTFNPFGNYDGLSFKLGFWGNACFNGQKFADLSIGFTEEWQITVDQLDNLIDPVTAEAATTAAKAVVNPRKTIFEQVVPEEVRYVFRYR